jgi:hypothetical protein
LLSSENVRLVDKFFVIFPQKPIDCWLLASLLFLVSVLLLASLPLHPCCCCFYVVASFTTTFARVPALACTNTEVSTVAGLLLLFTSVTFLLSLPPSTSVPDQDQKY